MEEDIKKKVIIIALDNLIETYKNALDELKLTAEEEEFTKNLINISQTILSEMCSEESEIKRPIWNKQ